MNITSLASSIFSGSKADSDDGLASKFSSLLGHCSAIKDGVTGDAGGGGLLGFAKDLAGDAWQGIKNAIPAYHVFEGAKDLATGHPFKALGQGWDAAKGTAQIATLLVPGLGEGELAMKGTELAAKVGTTVAKNAMSDFAGSAFDTALSHGAAALTGASEEKTKQD